MSPNHHPKKTNKHLNGAQLGIQNFTLRIILGKISQMVKPNANQHVFEMISFGKRSLEIFHCLNIQLPVRLLCFPFHYRHCPMFKSIHLQKSVQWTKSVDPVWAWQLKNAYRTKKSSLPVTSEIVGENWG